MIYFIDHFKMNGFLSIIFFEERKTQQEPNPYLNGLSICVSSGSVGFKFQFSLCIFFL